MHRPSAPTGWRCCAGWRSAGRRRRASPCEAGRLRGFVFGRDGREAQQIGPLCADDLPTAMRLIGDVLPEASGPLYLDLLDDKDALLPWLQRQGFALQRPFTRMVHGASSAPGDPRSIVLVAGPELG